MLVIGVAGQAQMGKDTLADRLCDRLNYKEGWSRWKREAFAYGVKEVFSETFDVTRDFIEEWKVKDEVPPGFDMTVRKGLQFIGDGFRQIQADVWVNRPFKKKVPKVISDVRYPNEFQRIKQEGGFNILIGRPDKLSDDPNGSEALIKPYVKWALDNFEAKITDIQEALKCDMYHDWPENFELFDAFVCNDGTMEELYENIENIVLPQVEVYFEEEKDAVH